MIYDGIAERLRDAARNMAQDATDSPDDVAVGQGIGVGEDLLTAIPPDAEMLEARVADLLIGARAGEGASRVTVV